MAGRLQDVSSETDETSKASTRRSESLVGGTSKGSSSSRLSGAGNSVGSSRLVGDVLGWWSNMGGADVAASVGSNADNWLGDRARAVGDCQGGSLGHGVGDIVVGDDGRHRAVGGVSSDDLSGI